MDNKIDHNYFPPYNEAFKKYATVKSALEI